MEKDNASTAVHLEKVEGGDNQLEKVEVEKVDADTEIVHAGVGDTSVSVVLSKVRMWTKYLYYFILLTLWCFRLQCDMTLWNDGMCCGILLI